MVEQLFGSKTRVKLLRLFFTNPNRSFYVREITRKVDEQINSVRRELANLLSVGIISSDNTTNNKLYYQVNSKYMYYKPLKQIFGHDISEDEEDVITEETEELSDAKLWKQAGNLQLVLYTGVLTRDDRAEVDILIVGDVNASKVAKIVEVLEEQNKTELRYAVMNLEEWKYREQIRDRFYETILTGRNQVVSDKEGLIK